MSAPIICQRCGSIDDYYTEVSGPHIKAICNGCDRYIKFIKQVNPAPGNMGVTIYMDNLMITGSMCFTDLVEQAKKGHSAFSKSEKNGKIYFNYVEWVNPNESESWKQASFQLNSTKEKREEELKANDGKKIYFGNGKLSEKSGGNSAPVQSSDVADLDLNDLPF